MGIKELRKRLAALQIDSNAVEFKSITYYMTLAEAMQVYNENLRASRSYFPRPTGDMPTLEEATKIYNKEIAMPARNIQGNSR